MVAQIRVCFNCGVFHPFTTECNPHDVAIWSAYIKIAKRLRKRWGRHIMQKSLLKAARLYRHRKQRTADMLTPEAVENFIKEWGNKQ